MDSRVGRSCLTQLLHHLDDKMGGGGHEHFCVFPAKMAKDYFIVFLSDGKIVYYQDVPQLPVPLNTLQTIHLNAKSHDLL